MRAAVALAAAALALRAWGLERYVVDLHELFLLHAARAAPSWGAFLSGLRERPLHPPLEPALSAALARACGEPWCLRLQPLLVGAAAVPALLLLGRRLGGAGAGAAAAALLAFSVHHAEFSGFADFYPHLALGALLCTLALLRAVEDGGARGFALYAAALGAFLYAHPFALLVAAFHAAWLAAARRDRLRPFVLSCAAALAAAAPWYASALSRLAADPAATFAAAGHARPLAEWWWTLRCWAGEPERGLYDPARYQRAAAAAAVFFAALAALGARRLRREGRWDARWGLAALLAFAGPPAVIALDAALGYDYMPRQSLFALPFFLLFVAEGLAGLGAPGRPARWAAPALCAALGAFFLREYAAQTARMRSRFVLVAQQTARETRPGDTLLFDEPDFAAWFLFYYDRAAFHALGAPELREGFRVFRLPPGLTAGGGRRVSVVWDPLEDEAAERARWADLAARRAAGTLRDADIHLSLMRPSARAKADAFLRSLPPAP